MLSTTRPHVLANVRHQRSLVQCPRWLPTIRQQSVVKAQAPGSSGGYYPPVPPAYQPVEPSAPYSTSDYSQSNYGSGYSTPTGYGSAPTDYSSGYSASSIVSDADRLAAAEQDALRQSAGSTRTLSFLGFWIQFALSIVSAGILLFSSAFVPQVVAGGAVVNVSKWLTLGGVIAAFISSLMAHGFLTLSKKLLDGGTVGRGYMVATLLTNNAICLAGILITVIGLQASVGTLVAKSLMTAMSGPYTTTTAANALVSLDVFALQASTNTLLCHVVGMLFTNMMLRIVNRATPKTT